MLIACLMFAMNVQAQLTKAVVTNKAYIDSQVDTTLTVSNMGVYDNVSLVFHSTDSAVVKIYIDIRPFGLTTWTLKDSVTITNAVNAGTYYDWQICGSTVDKVAGVTYQIRFRPNWSTNNGVTAAKYWLTLNYR